jgi:small subunit ribosomal protein S20
VANSASARKRARTAEVSRQHNVNIRSNLRTHIKNVVKAIDAGDAETAQKNYTAATPVIDASVSKGIIHRNKAARHKSRLNARIRAISA